jgi:hypothetical protein
MALALRDRNNGRQRNTSVEHESTSNLRAVQRCTRCRCLARLEMDVMTSITLRTLSLLLTVALLTPGSSIEAATIYVNAKAKGRDGHNPDRGLQVAFDSTMSVTSSTFHANAAVGDGGAWSCSHASGEGR